MELVPRIANLGQETKKARKLRAFRSSRGDPCCTFVDETLGLSLAIELFPQVIDFEGHSVLELVTPGLYRKGSSSRKSARSQP